MLEKCGCHVANFSNAIPIQSTQFDLPCQIGIETSNACPCVLHLLDKMAVTRALSGLLHLALLLLFVSPFGFFLYIERRNVSMLYMYASWSDVTREIHCDFRVLRSRIHCGRQMFLRGRLPYDVDGTQTFQLIRLSGDIHLNPGPPRRGIKYPCGECQRSVRRNQDAILCHQCNRWFHVKCTGMSKQTFTYYLDQYNLDWECSLCALQRLNDSFSRIANSDCKW